MLVFNNPWYLLLLALLPVMWWFSFDSLSGLGRWRRLMALAFRSLVLLLIVAALAEMQYQRTSDRLTVIYLLDQSLSIPEARRDAMISYVNASMRDQRKADKNDRAGVIVFGRNAEVEVPPVDFTIQLGNRIESLLDREFTNLAGAMQRAMSMFPHDTAKRIVLVTDGNQNIGDALAEARSVADAGVSIDVLPVPLDRQSDVAVEKIAMPPDIRRNQPFEVRVVVNNATDSNGAGHPIKGRIRIVRKAGDHQETLVDEPMEIQPGKSVFPFRQNIDQADFYTYEARFVPDDPAADAISQNNEATAFTHVQGKGLVLLIENWEMPGEFDHLVQRLRHEGLEVAVQPSNRLFTSLPELQRYDTVILADVPRASGDETANVSSFSDDQIKMLVRNTEELGCGLIMLGGPNSFGAGGWANTELEKAMPVDFQIKSAKVVPVGALVLNMHASEIPQANYWQKVIAQEALKALGPARLLRAGLLRQFGSVVMGTNRSAACRNAPRRPQSPDDARKNRQNVDRRYAEFRSEHEESRGRIGWLHRRGHQTHDPRQRRRPRRAQPKHHQRAQARRRHRHHRGGRRSRPGRQHDVAKHRERHRRQVLHR